LSLKKVEESNKAGYYLTKLMIAISTFKGDKRRIKKTKEGIS